MALDPTIYGYMTSPTAPHTPPPTWYGHALAAWLMITMAYLIWARATKNWGTGRGKIVDLRPNVGVPPREFFPQTSPAGRVSKLIASGLLASVRKLLSLVAPSRRHKLADTDPVRKQDDC
jgi:hypothetical protein